jgi:hypothetical protein
MKKQILTLLSVFLFHAMTFAQLWTKQFNGTGNGDDEIKAMAIDNAGNVYVTGYSFSGANGNDYVTIKYNTSGAQQWLARYNGPGSGNDVANAIAVDNEGNVYVTGVSDQLTGTYINDDAATVKYNAQGIQQWVARFNGVAQRADAGNAIKRDAAGNVYITGFTTVKTGAYTKKDFLTVKYNSSGAAQWNLTYNGPANQMMKQLGWTWMAPATLMSPDTASQARIQSEKMITSLSNTVRRARNFGPTVTMDPSASLTSRQPLWWMDQVMLMLQDTAEAADLISQQ